MAQVRAALERLIPDPDPLLVAQIEQLGCPIADVWSAVASLVNDAQNGRPPITVGGRKVYDLLVEALSDDDQDPREPAAP